MKYLKFLLSLIVSIQISGQIEHFVPTKINEKEIRHFAHRITYETTYLGTFTHKHKRYHVVKTFVKTQAAISIHGNSFVYILDATGILRTFHFDMPDELPNHLENSNLIFQSKSISLLQNDALVDVICTDKDGCTFSDSFILSQDTL